MTELISPERKGVRRAAVRDVLESRDVDHFNASELYQHHNPAWPYDDEYPPPTGLADEIGRTVQVADEIRERWGGPVRVVSGFRTHVYNDLLRDDDDNDHLGAEDSQHLYFRALDLQPVNARSDDYSTWVRHVEQIIAEKRNRGECWGLGRYNTFVHIDAGGRDSNANWHPRSE